MFISCKFFNSVYVLSLDFFLIFKLTNSFIVFAKCETLRCFEQNATSTLPSLFSISL